MYFFKESRVTVKLDKHEFNGQDKSPMTKLGYPNRPSNAQAWLPITKIMNHQTPWQPRQLGGERERVHKLKVKKIIWKAKPLTLLLEVYL